MKHLHTASWGITALGLLAIIATAVLGLDTMWLMGGILLTWAGIVKIIVVLIWTRVARIGSDHHLPEKSI
jgi:hypothetical protein